MLQTRPGWPPPPISPPGQFVGGRQQFLGVSVGVLSHADEVLVAAAVGGRSLQVPAQASVLPEKHVPVGVQPVQYLSEETQGYKSGFV